MSSIKNIILNGVPTSSDSNSSIIIHHEYWFTLFGTANCSIDSSIVDLIIHSIDTPCHT